MCNMHAVILSYRHPIHYKQGGRGIYRLLDSTLLFINNLTSIKNVVLYINISIFAGSTIFLFYYYLI